MEMGLVSDIFLIDLVGAHTLRSKPIKNIQYKSAKEKKTCQKNKQTESIIALLTFSKATKRIPIETYLKSLQYDYLHVLQLRASDEDEIPR